MTSKSLWQSYYQTWFSEKTFWKFFEKMGKINPPCGLFLRSSRRTPRRLCWGITSGKTMTSGCRTGRSKLWFGTLHLSLFYKFNFYIHKSRLSIYDVLKIPGIFGDWDTRVFSEKKTVCHLNPRKRYFEQPLSYRDGRVYEYLFLRILRELWLVTKIWLVLNTHFQSSCVWDGIFSG